MYKYIYIYIDGRTLFLKLGRAERPSVTEAKAIECTIGCKKILLLKQEQKQTNYPKPERSGGPDSQRRDTRDPKALYSMHPGARGIYPSEW